VALVVKKDTFSPILIGEFYELNLNAFNNIFGFPPSINLPY